jgi:hypothetical protein
MFFLFLPFKIIHSERQQEVLTPPIPNLLVTEIIPLKHFLAIAMYSSLSFALLLCIFLSRISQSITCIMEITIGHYVLNEHIWKRTNKRVAH